MESGLGRTAVLMIIMCWWIPWTRKWTMQFAIKGFYDNLETPLKQ